MLTTSNEGVNATGILYRNPKTKALSSAGEIEKFNVKAGVLQEDTLAPCLFLNVLVFAMIQAIVKKTPRD